MREITSFIRDHESLVIVSATCRDFRALELAQRELLADPAHVFNFRLLEAMLGSAAAAVLQCCWWYCKILPKIMLL